MAQPLQRFSTEGSAHGPTCWPCRFAKRKCDRQVPCSRCRRFDLHCVPQLRGRGRPPNNPGHRPKTRQRRFFDPPSTRSRAKLTMGEGEVGADRGTSDYGGDGCGGGGDGQEEGAGKCGGRDGMEEDWVSGEVCHVQDVQRPFADLDPVKSVSLSISDALKRAYSTGTLDGAKLAAALLGIEMCNKRCGRDSARFVRDTLNWAITVVQPAFPPETELTKFQHTMDSEYLKQLADENVCYVQVTMASHTATIVTSKLMEEVFASGEELMDYIDQTGLIYLYAFTRFVAAASIGPLIEALSVQAFHLGYYGCVSKVIEAQDRAGRQVRCLASVARRVSIAEKSLTIVMRLLPLMNNPSFVANRPQTHRTKDKGARVSPVGVHGGSAGSGSDVGGVERPVLPDGAVRSCKGDAVTVIIAPPLSTPPPPAADAASTAVRSDPTCTPTLYEELPHGGQPLSQGSVGLSREVKMERRSEQQRPLRTPQVSSPSSEAAEIHDAQSEARHADMWPSYVHRPPGADAFMFSTEVAHAYRAHRAHVLSGGGPDICGSDGPSYGSSSSFKPSQACINRSGITPDMHDTVDGTCHLLGEEAERGWGASMRLGSGPAGTAGARQGGARHSMQTSADRWPMYRLSIPERALGQYHPFVSSLSATYSATTVGDHVKLSVKSEL